MLKTKATMKKSNLSESEIKSLVKYFKVYKEAEKIFREKRDEITKGLKEGKYVGKYGTINKSSHIRNYIDHNAILEAHPEIDVEMFTTTKKAELITITVNN